MSSFGHPHRMYLFRLKNGKQKLAYGTTPEDALEILRFRLTDEEMDEILIDDYIGITQRELQQHISNLG